ncbi:MAG: hypothetical protein NTX28_02290 [Novosphingobium sp.]|nr:hypothetical protein [Novosphingobium sp.]
MPDIKLPALARLALIFVLTLPLAAFHGFVGWYKAFSTQAELAQHKAWTMHLPVALGKAVGCLEMALTLALLLALVQPRFARLGAMACGALVVLEVASLITHQVTNDGAPPLQNVVTVAVTAVLGWLHLSRARTMI